MESESTLAFGSDLVLDLVLDLVFDIVPIHHHRHGRRVLWPEDFAREMLGWCRVKTPLGTPQVQEQEQEQGARQEVRLKESGPGQEEMQARQEATWEESVKMQAARQADEAVKKKKKWKRRSCQQPTLEELAQMQQWARQVQADEAVTKKQKWKRKSYQQPDRIWAPPNER